MKRIVLIFLLIASSIELSAQANSFAKNNLPIWNNARSNTLEVARAMPEDKYDYKPSSEVMSFGQQMAHIANSMRSMETRFLKKEPWNKREPNASNMSKQQIIELLENSFDEVIKTIGALSESDLIQPGKTAGSPPLNKEQSMLFMYDHITNHRAKAVLYLRMNSIRPPAYRFN